MKFIRLHWFLWTVFFYAVQALSQTKAIEQTKQLQKPPSVLDSPVDFSGWQGTTLNPKHLKEIRIGFFAPYEPDDQVGYPMLNAALLAVEEANAAGGFQGIPFQLIKRWAYNPWASGAKEVIKMIYKDSVWAVIGSLNGDATHIAEQIVTKAWLPLISPVSADPTLTYIRIPWMFRLPPDDNKQAQIIQSKGIRKLFLKKVGLITSTNHDDRIFALEMLAKMKAGEIPPVFHFQVSLTKLNFEDLVKHVASFNPDGIISRLPRPETMTLMAHFQNCGFNIPVFIPWIPGLEAKELDKQYSSDILYVLPFSETGNPAYATFARTYILRYGRAPTPSAAYTYDAVNLLVQALQKSGLNRSGLRNAITALSGYQGVSGEISWDNGGGSQAEPILMKLLGKQ